MQNLLVEDAAGLRQIMAMILAQAGVKTIEAENEAEALRSLDSQPLALVNTDNIMPEMAGMKHILIGNSICRCL